MNHRTSATRTFLIACCIVVAGAVAWRLLAPRKAQGPAPVAAQSGPPVELPRNVIVFETDDQRWDTLDLTLATEGRVMPNVYNIFVENGVHFENAFVTNPTCCPSRAAQLAGGFYSHNTGVLTNTWPNGSALRFKDTTSLAMRMRAKGYYNVLVGKYMNGYEDLQVNNKKSRYIPPGWDVFMVVYDPRTGTAITNSLSAAMRLLRLQSKAFGSRRTSA